MRFLSSLRILCIYLIIVSGLIVSCESSSDDSSDSASDSRKALLITGFSVSPGVLSPEFSSSQKNYTLSLPEGISEISVTLECSDDCEIYIRNNRINPGVSASISVSKGDIISVSLKSADGVETVYSVTVQVDEETAVWEKTGEFNTSFKPGGILCRDGRIYIHQGRSVICYFESGNKDSSWGKNGSVSGLASSAANDVGISIDAEGNIYVPSSGSGNVEMVSADGTVSPLILDSEGSAVDLGLTKGVAVNSGGSLLYVAQTSSSDGVICGLYRFEKIEGRWYLSTGENGTTAWAENGIMVNAVLNSNMRSLCILSDGRVLVSCGSASKKVFEIPADGSSVREVINLSATGENCGETGSCNYISVSGNLLFIPVICKSAGMYSGIRIYNITSGEYSLNSLIENDSQNGISFPGDGSDEEIRGVYAVSENTIVYALSDESVTIISFQ